MSEDGKSRREFIKIAAGLTGAVVLGGVARKLVAQSEKPAGEAERMHVELLDALKKKPSERKWRMGVDIRKCIGCDSCSVACAIENVAPVGKSYRTVYKVETGDYKDMNKFFMPTNCQQCDDAPCMKAANAITPDAITKREDGIVVLNYEVLKRSKEAQEAAKKACPYTAIVDEEGAFYTANTPKKELYEDRSIFEYGSEYKNKSALKGVIRKCTYCLHRLNSGILPACVTSCIGRAMYFGDANDTSSLLYEKFKTNAYTLKPENKPNVAYLGYKDKAELPAISSESCVVCHGKGGGA